MGEGRALGRMWEEDELRWLTGMRTCQPGNVCKVHPRFIQLKGGTGVGCPSLCSSFSLTLCPKPGPLHQGEKGHDESMTTMGEPVLVGLRTIFSPSSLVLPISSLQRAITSAYLPSKASSPPTAGGKGGPLGACEPEPESPPTTARESCDSHRLDPVFFTGRGMHTNRPRMPRPQEAKEWGQGVVGVGGMAMR